MNVGIMGGTFDPIHNGHISVAKAVKQACALDKVLIMPSGDPPHKHLSVSKEDRMAMVHAALVNEAGLEACAIEVQREGRTYTVDTLREMKKKHPKRTLVYIIGEDTLQVLDSWRDFANVAKLTRFAVVRRPGSDAAVTKEKLHMLKKDYGAEIMLVDAEGPDISSTQVRDTVLCGKSISGLVPEGVERYIREKGLYLCSYTWAEVDAKLRELLTEKRYEHTLGVAQTAVELAELHGVDVQRARLAGLLHDCAKYMDREKMFAYVRENCPDVDEEELSMKSVVHAPAGMLMARDEFGVRDADVLSSIRKHTLGDGVMSDLDLIIYIADFIEPNREVFEGMEEARDLAKKDLVQCAKLCARLSGAYVLAKGYSISPRTEKMLNSI